MDEPGLALARRGTLASRATITAVSTLSALFFKYATRARTYGLDRFTSLVAPSAAAAGDSHPRKGRPLITISNHCSCIDDPVLMGALPWRQLLRAAGSGMMRWTPGSRPICYANSVLGYFFGMGQVVPVSWGGGVFQEGMRIAQERLNHGDWVHIFPEGRVNQTGQIWPFKWGVGQLVLETTRRHGVGPILLLLVHSGMEEVLSEERIYIPKIGKRVDLAVSEPFDVDALVAYHAHEQSSDDRIRAHITDVIQMKVADLQHQLHYHPNTLQQDI